jgi:tRNA U34 5-carboxymethylaminomethyl modifying GTPase MnmE/TrmE
VKIRSRYPATVPRIFNNRLYSCCVLDAAWLIREIHPARFPNGKLDLSQAEAVADLISSDNAASHQIAMQQMRGGFSNEIAKLREELLNFASLSNSNSTLQKMWNLRTEQFNELLNRIEFVLKRLIDSFAVGNVIKTEFRLQL